MERTVTWDALQKEILEKMRHLLRPGVYIQVGGAPSSWTWILNIVLKRQEHFYFKYGPEERVKIL